MSVRSIAVSVFLMVIVMIATPASADFWYEHYARAERALEDGEWDEVVKELNEALERRGDSGARVRSYGMNVVAYFPYLKLGIAYFNLGHLDAALQAFETEERLGAIDEDLHALASLQRHRQLTIDARDEAAADARRRIEEIVAAGLAEAEGERDEGRLDEAMESLGKVLAVDPGNTEALASMEDLRSAVAERDRQREASSRAQLLVGEARRLLAAGRASEASQRLREALALAANPETRRLLDEVEAVLVAEVRAEQDQAAQGAMVDEALARAHELVATGEIEQALVSLQPVLAVDPRNVVALELQRSVLATQRADAMLAEVRGWLAEADAEHEAGRFEKSVVAANRALALDAGNLEALERVRRAYGRISERLLGSSATQNIPPAIRFSDLREELDDGSRVQSVRSADFRLSGVVIDHSPVEVSFFAGDDGQIQGQSVSQSVGGVYIAEFILSLGLRPGESTFRVVATDEQGLSSAGEYTVVYARPVFRSPWFSIAVAVVLVSAAAWVVGARLRHRRRLRRRRFNPYIAGAPVLDEDLFFGRESLIERILQTIHNNSLLLFGERRIGKTSLQHHLKRRLQELDDPGYVFIPVYVDLQGTPEERFFATLADDIWHEVADRVEGLEPSAALVDGSDFGYREIVAELRRIISTLKKRHTRRVKIVLLIDEVDELNAYDPRINQKLRSLFMKSFAENLVAVVSGVEIRKQWEREGSPWYNFFEEVEVSAIHREDAEALIVKPIQGVFKVQSGVVDRIIEITDCRPYLIQKHCVALVNRLHDENRTVITVEDVDAVGRPE